MPARTSRAASPGGRDAGNMQDLPPRGSPYRRSSGSHGTPPRDTTAGIFLKTKAKSPQRHLRLHTSGILPVGMSNNSSPRQSRETRGRPATTGHSRPCGPIGQRGHRTTRAPMLSSTGSSSSHAPPRSFQDVTPADAVALHRGQPTGSWPAMHCSTPSSHPARNPRPSTSRRCRGPSPRGRQTPSSSPAPTGQERLSAAELIRLQNMGKPAQRPTSELGSTLS